MRTEIPPTDLYLIFFFKSGIVSLSSFRVPLCDHYTSVVSNRVPFVHPRPLFAPPLPSPRSLSFSYGRALQQSTLKAWQGKAENLGAAQDQLKARAQANSEANLGKYVAGSQPSADETLFVKGYKY